MKESDKASLINRKEALKRMVLASGVLIFPGFKSDSFLEKFQNELRNQLKGNVNHSVCKWCYPDVPLEQLCEVGKEIGLKSIELLDPHQWAIVDRYGLTCAMANSSPLHITKGFNNPVYHDRLKLDYEELLPQAAEYGLTRMICFSGNREGMNDKTGLENCARGLKPVIRKAKKYGITICMELLNSTVDHPDYQCDRTEWGVKLVDKVGSAHFKLLYDIYHMQIMEGNVIATIRQYKDYFDHYHTAGVPGRNEIDDSQELNYSAKIGRAHV